MIADKLKDLGIKTTPDISSDIKDIINESENKNNKYNSNACIYKCYILNVIKPIRLNKVLKKIHKNRAYIKYFILQYTKYKPSF